MRLSLALSPEIDSLLSQHLGGVLVGVQLAMLWLVLWGVQVS